MESALQFWTANSALSPTGFLVPEENVVVIKMVIRAGDEGWDRRRLKRELRKGEKSTYGKSGVKA